MLRLILAIIFLLFSLLTVLPIPARQAWYPAIAISEFPWIWTIVSAVLLLWILKTTAYKIPAALITCCAIILFVSPIVRAYTVAKDLDERIFTQFGVRTTDLEAPHRNKPYSITQMIAGIGASEIPYTTYDYAVHSGETLSLNFYPSQIPGVRPCLLMVHGGSWRSGNNGELPEVNWYFAKAGYQVASINYRLAPGHKFPAQLEDVHASLIWLKQHAADLNIDTNNFVLMGRSAGGQIVLSAAYRLNEPGVKGVVGFYGAADMLYAYDEPHNKLVMDHQMVLRDYLGGSPDQVRQQYIDASPVSHVTPNSIPALIVHGNIDEHVHFAESEHMAAALKKNNIPHLLLALPWATHGCEYTINGPSGQLAIYSAERFMYAVTQKQNVVK
jgi:acetyl esterase/lipase